MILYSIASWTALATTVLAIPTPSCDRESLIKATDSYIAAQTAGNLVSLQSTLASNWTYTENNKLTDVKKGVLAKPLKIDHRRTNADTTACRTYTELIVADPATPYVIGTQIQYDASLKITSIDTIASTTGSWLFDAKKTLQYVLAEKWDPIPVSKQDSRALIQAAGDAYMDMWNNATASEAVPWGTPCTRLEGSAYTGKGLPDDSCKPGIPANHNQAPNTHRRYVVDEVMGSS
ncbi:hypothetical protein GLAREA_06487 [Glarea lozoyensis ATCC 20868]|uniref:DUF8021 domain-containing protein n=1 Tax=Glarea lozoyensis (strain ATCC 20868 / MF5171) TaxID=1116229 RepID=S3D8I8_GLAL2|nr:uncharacterized protein GLAREA_06487 [Glarea lozoyensis ATCC 20868]EPE33474.1 hypothetical protein GLAREA_06487 [Glarea lozoyensis ATCC 20868]